MPIRISSVANATAAPDGMAGTVWFDDLKLEEGDRPTAFRPDWIDSGELYSQEPQIPWLPLPADFRCSLAVVTPHVELARPYAGGAPRMLWAGFYNNARTACELAQRGDLALDSVVLNGSSTDVAGVRIMHQRCIDVFRARLGVQPKLSADRAPQVLVIEQGILELLNRQDRAAILDRVRQGMGCVVLLGPICVPDHPGAIATPKIKELIDAAEKLPEAGHGHVLTALNVAQHPGWDRSTLGIETVYSDILQSIYRSIGRPAAEVEANACAAAAHRQHAVDGVPFPARARLVRVRVVPDLPTPDSASLMDGHGVAVPRSVVADVRARSDGSASPLTRLAMPPLPAGNYMLLAQTLDDRKQVLGWSLVPLTVASTVEIAKLDAGTASLPAATSRCTWFARSRTDTKRFRRPASRPKSPTAGAGSWRGPARRYRFRGAKPFTILHLTLTHAETLFRPVVGPASRPTIWFSPGRRPG